MMFYSGLFSPRPFVSAVNGLIAVERALAFVIELEDVVVLALVEAPLVVAVVLLVVLVLVVFFLVLPLRFLLM